MRISVSDVFNLHLAITVIHLIHLHIKQTEIFPRQRQLVKGEKGLNLQIYVNFFFKKNVNNVAPMTYINSILIILIYKLKITY